MDDALERRVARLEAALHAVVVHVLIEEHIEAQDLRVIFRELRELTAARQTSAVKVSIQP